MKQKALAGVSCCLLIVCATALGGCASRPAPDFGGRWKAVNRYAASTEEIPLAEPYEFHASPLDGTLRNMLTRWAGDSKMTLSYLHPSDFTLHAPVAQIRTNDLQQAVSQLTAAYAAQRISVQAEGNRIVVQALGTGANGAGHEEVRTATSP